MTAKQALLEAVEAMTEERAAEVLRGIQEFRRKKPLPSEMLRMSESELDALFKQFPPGADGNDDTEWIAGLDPDAEEYRHLDDLAK